MNDALSVYKEYLKTPRTFFDGTVKLPVRTSLLNSMVKVHEEKKELNKAYDLLNETNENGGRVLFWSDPHFFHKNIIKYCNRPFASPEEMNNFMMKTYHKEVKENDVIVWGGDISFGNPNNTRGLIDSLPGKKILILGNHDFDRNGDFIKWGHFDATVLGLELEEKVEDEVWKLWLTHYPIDEHWLPEQTINVHGHIHAYVAGQKYVNISVEHTNYKPEKIRDRVKETVFNIKNGIFPAEETLESFHLKKALNLR